MPEKRTYCISDIHAGWEYCNYEKTNKLLDEIQNKADELIIAGDFYDLWRMSWDEITTMDPVKTTHELFLETIKEVPYTYIKGNHDYEISNYLDIKPIDHMVRDNILFIHGHQFDVAQWFGFPFAKLITKYFPYIYEKYYRQAFKTLMTDEQIDQYFIDYHNRIQEFAELKGYDYIVCGHSHCPIIDGRLADIGDMADSNSFVIIEDGHPLLCHI